MLNMLNKLRKNIASNTLQLMDIHSWGKQAARSILLDKIRCVYSKRAHLMSKYNQRRLFKDLNSCSIFLYALSQLTICLISLLHFFLLTLFTHEGSNYDDFIRKFRYNFFLFSCASYELWWWVHSNRKISTGKEVLVVQLIMRKTCFSFEENMHCLELVGLKPCTHFMI